MKILLTSDIHYNYSVYAKNKVTLFIETLPDIDILILAGDTISHDQKEWSKILQLFRKRYAEIPILLVRGNHDYWDDYDADIALSFDDMNKSHQNIFKKYNITHLQGNYFEHENVKFWGYDDWYQHPNPLSNDTIRIPFGVKNNYHFPIEKIKEFHISMKKVADQQLQNILDTVNNDDTNILITHFNPFKLYRDSMAQMDGNLHLPEIIGNDFKYVFFGHTHKEFFREINGVTYVNTGSEYEYPEYKLFRYDMGKFEEENQKRQIIK